MRNLRLATLALVASIVCLSLNVRAQTGEWCARVLLDGMPGRRAFALRVRESLGNSGHLCEGIGGDGTGASASHVWHVTISSDRVVLSREETQMGRFEYEYRGDVQDGALSLAQRIRTEIGRHYDELPSASQPTGASPLIEGRPSATPQRSDGESPFRIVHPRVALPQRRASPPAIPYLFIGGHVRISPEMTRPGSGIQVGMFVPMFGRLGLHLGLEYEQGSNTPEVQRRNDYRLFNASLSAEYMIGTGSWLGVLGAGVRVGMVDYDSYLSDTVQRAYAGVPFRSPFLICAVVKQIATHMIARVSLESGLTLDGNMWSDRVTQPFNLSVWTLATPTGGSGRYWFTISLGIGWRP